MSRRHRPRDTPAPFDGAAIRRRRVQIGLSQAALAQVAGVSPGILRTVEAGGPQLHLSVGAIGRIAAALGTTIIELGARREPPGPMEADDVRLLGSALASAGWVDVAELAASFGWTLDRTHHALEGLSTALADVGQRVAWFEEQLVRVVPEIDAGERAAPAVGASLARSGLDSNEAAILYALHRPAGNSLRPNPIALHRLAAVGLVDLDAPARRGRPAKARPGSGELSEAARYALCLE